MSTPAVISAALQRGEAALGAVPAFGFGSVDLFHFKVLAQSTDLVFVMLGLSVLTGISLTKSIAGAVASATSSSAP